MQWHRLSLLVVAFLTGYCRESLAEDFAVAFWNVENLFDTQDDPRVELDEEFTPDGDKQWTEERLQIKLQNLARVLVEMNDGRGPDLLGLAEVENRVVVERLVQELKKLNRSYEIIHRDSPSDRGIDCAVLFDAKRLKAVRHAFHQVPDLKTREIIEASFEIGGHPLTVFVNHWPSQFNPEEARVAAASVVRKRVDELFQSDPQSDFLIMGDLNESPLDPAVSKTLRTWGNPKTLHPGVLFNSTWSVFEAKLGTYVFQNRWNLLDHLILSPGLLDERGLSWVENSTAPVKFDYQMYAPKSPTAKSIPRPSRSYNGDRFQLNGYSDHLPIACRIRIQSP